jgi:hypothetical protein
MTAMKTHDGRNSRIASVVLLSLVAAACSGESSDSGSDHGSSDAGPVSDRAAATEGSTHDAGDPRLEPIIPEPSEACPELTVGAQTVMGLRTEIVAGTPGAAKGPMLFTWHGNPGTGQGALNALLESVRQDIVQQGGLIIAPTSNGEIRSGVNVAGRAWFDDHDLRFADLLVACAVKNHNIDPRRIYVTGCSAGGLMAGVMAMMRSSYVAAAAPESGGLARPRALQDPMRAPAVMVMHGGSSDVTVSTSGFFDFGTTSKILLDALAPSGAFLVNCNHASGHCNASALARKQAWEFMKAHPFGKKPSPYAGGLPVDFPGTCEIYRGETDEGGGSVDAGGMMAAQCDPDIPAAATCGGTRCPLPIEELAADETFANVFCVVPCCLPNDECGNRRAHRDYTTACAPPAQKDPGCPDHATLPATARGCCAPSGHCGFISNIDLSCVTSSLTITDIVPGAACGDGPDAGAQP